MKTECVCVCHLLDVLDALDDVAAFDRLLDGVGVAQDAQVFLGGLLDQAGGQSGQVGQLPQHLQHLHTHTDTHTDTHRHTDTQGSVRRLQQHTNTYIDTQGRTCTHTPSQWWPLSELLVRSSR